MRKCGDAFVCVCVDLSKSPDAKLGVIEVAACGFYGEIYGEKLFIRVVWE